MIERHADAADEIADLFRLAADAAGWTVEWPNTRFEKPSTSDVWARWSLVHVDGGQSSLAGPNGARTFSKSGYVEIEIFTPLGIGTKLAYDAAQVALDAYEGRRTASDVWFRRARIESDGRGRGGDAAWWCTVVVADFVYDNPRNRGIA